MGDDGPCHEPRSKAFRLTVFVCVRLIGPSVEHARDTLCPLTLC